MSDDTSTYARGGAASPSGPPPRVQNEHREVCAFLTALMLERGSESLTWVDLGCGDRPRILGVMDEGLDPSLKERLRYVGCDRLERIRESATQDQAGPTREFHAFSLDQPEGWPSALTSGMADLVTMTNVVHEIPPLALPGALLAAARLLTKRGYLLVYDMEMLPDKDAFPQEEREGHDGSGPWKSGELDAITWRLGEITPLFGFLDEALGHKQNGDGISTSTAATVSVGNTGSTVSRWFHTTTTGWTVCVRAPARALDEAAVTRYHDGVRQWMVGQLAKMREDRNQRLLARLQQHANSGAGDEELRRTIQRQVPGSMRELLALNKAVSNADPSKGGGGTGGGY